MPHMSSRLLPAHRDGAGRTGSVGIRKRGGPALAERACALCWHQTVIAVHAFPAAVVDQLSSLYGLRLGAAVPLVGGYDIAADSWRVESDRGALVVRVDHSISCATACWLDGVLRRAADVGVPSCPPIAARDGAKAFSVGRATVTVRPFVGGVPIDRDDDVQVHAAGVMLASMQSALAGAHPDRPSPSPWDARFWGSEGDPPTLRDRELDAWQACFESTAGCQLSRGIVHGDYWAGNLIWADGEIAAVIDWTEARSDFFVRELAWATWEFGHDPSSRELDLERARTFLAGFRSASQGLERRLQDVLLPLMRIELRLHARYSLADPNDIEYNQALQHAFVHLRDEPVRRLLCD